MWSVAQAEALVLVEQGPVVGIVLLCSVKSLVCPASAFPSLIPGWEGVSLSKEGCWGGSRNQGRAPGEWWSAGTPALLPRGPRLHSRVALRDSGLCADILISLRPRTST